MNSKHALAIQFRSRLGALGPFAYLAGLFLAGMLIMAYNVLRTIAEGKSVEALIPAGVPHSVAATA